MTSRKHHRRRRELTTPPSLWKLVKGCETRCTTDCCGLDAFDVERHRVASWLESWGEPLGVKALESISTLIDDVADGDDEREISLTNIGDCGKRDELLRVLHEWRATLRTALAEYQGRPG